MGIGELFNDPRFHRRGRFWSNWRRRLIIEIDHAAALLARSLMERHSAANLATSSAVVRGPKLTRMTLPASSAGTCITWSTRLAFMLPDEQALPAEIARPTRSNCANWLALATFGIA